MERRVEWSVGGGLIYIIPYGHLEARYYAGPTTSLAAFLGVGIIPELWPGAGVGLLPGVGVEGRYHFSRYSSVDPHVGWGVGRLIWGGASLVWASAGVTVTLASGPRDRLDLEVLIPVLYSVAGKWLPVTTGNRPLLVPIGLARSSF